MTRSDRAFALDVLPIVIVSVAVCGWASDPVRMTVLVVALHLGRLVGWPASRPLGQLTGQPAGRPWRPRSWNARISNLRIF